MIDPAFDLAVQRLRRQEHRQVLLASRGRLVEAHVVGSDCARRSIANHTAELNVSVLIPNSHDFDDLTGSEVRRSDGRCKGQANDKREEHILHVDWCGSEWL